MHVSLAIVLGALGTACVGVALPSQTTPNELLQDLNDKAIDLLKESETQSTKKYGYQKCSVSEAAVRRNWWVEPFCQWIGDF